MHVHMHILQRRPKQVKKKTKSSLPHWLSILFPPNETVRLPLFPADIDPTLQRRLSKTATCTHGHVYMCTCACEDTHTRVCDTSENVNPSKPKPFQTIPYIFC